MLLCPWLKMCQAIWSPHECGVPVLCCPSFKDFNFIFSDGVGCLCMWVQCFRGSEASDAHGTGATHRASCPVWVLGPELRSPAIAVWEPNLQHILLSIICIMKSLWSQRNDQSLFLFIWMYLYIALYRQVCELPVVVAQSLTGFQGSIIN